MRAAPLRQVMIGKGLWDLRADHGAWYTLELITKRSYRAIVRRLLNSKSHRLEPLYLMLWALSSTYRVDQRMTITETDEDKRLKTTVPLRFVQQVDASIEGIDEIRAVVMDILVEAKLASWKVEDKEVVDSTAGEGQNPPAPPPSTGGGEPSTRSRRASRSTSSGEAP